MVKIRLTRLGRKKRPFYRIVVTDIRNRREGAALAELGYYNPLSKELKLNKALALEWISKGAIPTQTTQRLIDKAPEDGALVVLEKAQKERLSKKAQAKKQAEAEKTAEESAA
ncbi:MAG: 30S ribosomal protein S16 [Vampirovibrionales bacterium]|nr:30S ribosomal protein S16 [Vampirovibrionales bacterium]